MSEPKQFMPKLTDAEDVYCRLMMAQDMGWVCIIVHRRRGGKDIERCVLTIAG